MTYRTSTSASTPTRDHTSTQNSCGPELWSLVTEYKPHRGGKWLNKEPYIMSTILLPRVGTGELANVGRGSGWRGREPWTRAHVCCARIDRVWSLSIHVHRRTTARRMRGVTGTRRGQSTIETGPAAEQQNPVEMRALVNKLGKDNSNHCAPCGVGEDSM